MDPAQLIPTPDILPAPWGFFYPLLILIVVGFFFTNSLLLMIDPKVWPRYFQEPGGSLIHWAEPSLIPRYLHFLFASIAAGGLIMALMGRRQKKKGHAGAEDHIRQGLVLYGCVTLFQFLIGAWYLGGLPGRVLSQVFFDSSWAFPAFIISVMGIAVIIYMLRLALRANRESSL